MKTWVRKTLSVGVLAAGALLFAPGAAHADVRQDNGDNNGILNGTQVAVPVSVPINIVGNSLGILGEANSFGAGVNRVESTHAAQSNGDNNGILNGTQAYLPVSVPLNVAGNSAAVLGGASSGAVAANNVGGHGRRESAHTTEGGWFNGGSGWQSNGDNNGILNGTQLYAPISVPINACGNSLALLGGASSRAICGNDVFGGGSTRFRKGHHQESAKVTESAWQSNGDNNGILNGTQLYAPISLPVNLSGNSLAVLGGAQSQAISGNRIESAQGGHGGPGGFGQSNGDNNGIANGTQVAAPISIPVNVCGNSLAILGGASSGAVCGNDVFGGGFGGDSGWAAGGHGHGHGHGGPVLGGDNGHKGHGHGHGNKGDNGSYLGDNGTAPASNGDQGDKGYGGTAPASNGDQGDKGYGGTAPADAGYTKGGDKGDKGDKADSGYTRGTKAKSAEATPVTSLTNSVSDDSGLGGLGLLNTLR